MFAVPSQQIVNPVLGGCCNVDRVDSGLRRQSNMFHQCLCKFKGLGINGKYRQSIEKNQTFASGKCVACSTFIDGRLRRKQLKLVAIVSPPFKRQKLVRRNH